MCEIMILGFLEMLPHGAILIANMYIVFFLIDRVNTAMCFIDNDITKGLLVIMCLLSVIISASGIHHHRRAEKRRAMKKKRRHSRARG